MRPRKKTRMDRLLEIHGLNPATGEVLVVPVHAESEADAKARAEECGLLHVVVTEPDSSPRAGEYGL